MPKFIRYGEHWVPHRREQEQILLDLLRSHTHLRNAADLCCGQGRLSQAILGHFPDCRVHALDASDEMLQACQQLNASQASRLQCQKFQLEAEDWRKLPQQWDAVVSSLAIHHLDGAAKRQLFCDLFSLLRTDGILVVIDLVRPLTKIGYKTFARQWDAYVEHASRQVGDPLIWDIFREEHWNWYRYPEEDSYDQPSGLEEQLIWMREAGFEQVECHFLYAGHCVFSGQRR